MINLPKLLKHVVKNDLNTNQMIKKATYLIHCFCFFLNSNKVGP